MGGVEGIYKKNGDAMEWVNAEDEQEGLLRNQVPSAAAWRPALFAFPGAGAGAKVEEKRNN